MKKPVFFFIFFLICSQSFSQCAMCKAVAESDSFGKELFFQGLNTGILYLMLIPYILLSIAFTYNYLNRKNIF